MRRNEAPVAVGLDLMAHMCDTAYDMFEIVDKLRAAGEPSRFRLLRVLIEAREPLCICELVDIIRRPQYAVSRAMSALRIAGLVREERRGKLMYYGLITSPENDGVFHALACAEDESGLIEIDMDRLRWRLDLRENGSCTVTYTIGYNPKEYQFQGETMSEEKKPSVLFVCVHNSARSQMAEEYLRSIAGDFFDVESAGLEPGELNPVVVELLKDDGIDISGKQTRSVEDLYRAGKTYSYVVTVCDREAEEKCPVFPGPVRRLSWPFPDPSQLEGSPAEVRSRTRDIADQIKERVEGFARAQRARRKGA